MKIQKAVAFLVLLLGVSFLSARGDSGDPSNRVARLADIQGTVSVQPSGVDQWSQAQTNYPVATGDRLYTDRDGRDELNIGGVVVRMWHGTDLTMTNLSDQLTQLGLAQGTIRVRTFGLDPNQQIEVDTPNGAITVTRPGDIRVDSYEGDGGTQVAVNSGAVQVTGPNLSQNISAGQAVRLMGSNPIELQPVALPGADEFDAFSLARDRHMEDARSAQYVSRETPGYDDLDDYGSWDPGTEYGPVWYPRDVPADWAPYRVGHWVWTGPWGWTWVESEPWGYAPFHYGRWAYIGTRWGWVPGPVAVYPVWSPALVAFAGGVSFGLHFGTGIGLAAWFPLGVGEPYLPWYHCSPGYIRQINVTNINITRIRNVTIVNNYNNFVRNTNNYQNITSVRNTNFNYTNRERGFSAVNARTFASGQPISRNLERVDAAQIRNTSVIAHPSVQPTQRSIAPIPVRGVPVPVTRPTLLTRGGEMQARPGAHIQPVPYHAPANSGATSGARAGALPTAARGAAPGTANRYPTAANPSTRANLPSAGARPNAPNESAFGNRPLITRNGTSMPGRPAPGATERPNNGEPGSNATRGGYTAARPLVTRNEPPVYGPSFGQQQRGLSHDPGRPLTPQQRDNLQSGRRAGVAQDQEFYPHAADLSRQGQSAQNQTVQSRGTDTRYSAAPNSSPNRSYGAPQTSGGRPENNYQRAEPAPRSAPQSHESHGEGGHGRR